MVAFIIWAICGLLFVGIGISCFFVKGKRVGFFANFKDKEVENPEKFNKVMGRFWIINGLIFILIGVPLLSDNILLMIMTMIGTIFWMIGLMIVYLMVILPKFDKKKK